MLVVEHGVKATELGFPGNEVGRGIGGEVQRWGCGEVERWGGG